MEVPWRQRFTGGLVRGLQQVGTIAFGWQAAALSGIALSAALTIWWMQSGRLPLGGDEPHYLIMAVSVVRDGDFELRNNYWWDAETSEIWGPVDEHVIPTTKGWSPMHTPGLGVLLAAPWAVGGVVGSRLALCVIAFLLLALGSWRWMRESLAPRAAWFAALGVVACVPAVLGAAQIYPDLLCGAIVLTLVTWVWSTTPRRLPGWAGYWLLAGLLPWLHTKYFATSALLAAVGAWRAWRDRRRPALALSGLFAIGSGSLMWWHLQTYGGLLGWRRLGDLGTQPLRVLEVFLGLHLDQAQGLFFQQPLLLPGLVAIGYMAHRRHPLTVPWLLLYGSLIVPNSMELNFYGGHGPAGRFAWSAMWLWLVPLGIWLKAEQAAVGRYVRPIVLAGLAYQVALATRWIQAPSTLFPNYSELVWERNSLLPVDLRYSVPSFYFWDFESYLSYLPNVVWVAAAMLLLVTGFMWSTPRRNRLPIVWSVAIALAAIVLPVQPTADAASRADRAREEAIIRSVRSDTRQRFEAERLPPNLDSTRVEDMQASAGAAASQSARTRERVRRLRTLARSRSGILSSTGGARAPTRHGGGHRGTVRGSGGRNRGPCVHRGAGGAIVRRRLRNLQPVLRYRRGTAPRGAARPGASERGRAGRLPRPRSTVAVDEPTVRPGRFTRRSTARSTGFVRVPPGQPTDRIRSAAA